MVMSKKKLSIIVVVGFCLTLFAYYFFVSRWPLPSPSSVARIEADILIGSNFTKFDVAPEWWPKLWDTMQPATIDFLPAKWKTIGSITVKFKNNSSVFIGLYVLKETPGAFSIGPWYYRGGDSDKMKKVINAAYQASLTAKP